MIDWDRLASQAADDTHVRAQIPPDGGNKPAVGGNGKSPQPIEITEDSPGCSRCPAVPASLTAHQVRDVCAGESPGGAVLNADAPGNEYGRTRPVLDFVLNDPPGSGGCVIGSPGDLFEELHADLVTRYGPRLDRVALRERFEERAAILEFDAGHRRPVAEALAVAELMATPLLPSADHPLPDSCSMDGPRFWTGGGGYRKV